MNKKNLESVEHLSNLQYDKIVDTMFADIHSIANKSIMDEYSSSVVRYGRHNHHIANMFFKEQVSYESGLSTPLELKAAKYSFLSTWQKLYN